MMQLKDGFALSKEIRSLNVYYISYSKKYERGCIKGFEHGEDDYLTKPFNT